MVLKFFLLAVLFLFISCTSFERDNPNDPGGVNYIGDRPSSSSAPNQNVKYGDTIYYKNEAYATVIIGKQTWMAENLNYAVAGSKCGTDIEFDYFIYKLSDANTAICDKYGRLYDWETAKAVCPDGWRLPSDEEWQTLVDLAGGDEIAGKKLKAKSGWEDYDDGEVKSGNGEDKYGFAALPGGSGYLDGYFSSVGYDGCWWSATESGVLNAYFRCMYFNNEHVSRVRNNKDDYLFSVRCLKD